jgi:hypothetical protein
MLCSMFMFVFERIEFLYFVVPHLWAFWEFCMKFD